MITGSFVAVSLVVDWMPPEVAYDNSLLWIFLTFFYWVFFLIILFCFYLSKFLLPVAVDTINGLGLLGSSIRFLVAFNPICVSHISYAASYNFL